jgi:hypothetical protein
LSKSKKGKKIIQLMKILYTICKKVKREVGLFQKVNILERRPLGLRLGATHGTPWGEA